MNLKFCLNLTTAYLLPVTPASLGSPIWFDGSDASTMFQERTGASATTPSGVGDVVGSWKNKGSLGGWATAPADDARPIRRSSGRLEFDGSNDRLLLGAEAVDLFRNVSRGMIAGVVDPATGGSRHFAAWSTGTGGSRISAHYSATNKFAVIARRLDADSTQTVSSTNTYTGKRVARVHVDWGNSNAQIYVGSDFTENTSFLTDGSTEDTASTIVAIGAQLTVNFFAGYVYQIIAGAYWASDPVCARFDSFLASKL
jgi:hypothetical protein